MKVKLSIIPEKLSFLEKSLHLLHDAKIVSLSCCKEMYDAISSHFRQVKLIHLTGTPGDILEKSINDLQFFEIVMRFLLEINQMDVGALQRECIQRAYIWYCENKAVVYSGPKFGKARNVEQSASVQRLSALTHLNNDVAIRAFLHKDQLYKGSQKRNEVTLVLPSTEFVTDSPFTPDLDDDSLDAQILECDQVNQKLETPQTIEIQPLRKIESAPGRVHTVPKSALLNPYKEISHDQQLVENKAEHVPVSREKTTSIISEHPPTRSHTLSTIPVSTSRNPHLEKWNTYLSLSGENQKSIDRLKYCHPTQLPPGFRFAHLDLVEQPFHRHHIEINQINASRPSPRMSRTPDTNLKLDKPFNHDQSLDDFLSVADDYMNTLMKVQDHDESIAFRKYSSSTDEGLRLRESSLNNFPGDSPIGEGRLSSRSLPGRPVKREISTSYKPHSSKARLNSRVPLLSMDSLLSMVDDVSCHIITTKEKQVPEAVLGFRQPSITVDPFELSPLARNFSSDVPFDGVVPSYRLNGEDKLLRPGSGVIDWRGEITPSPLPKSHNQLLKSHSFVRRQQQRLKNELQQLTRHFSPHYRKPGVLGVSVNPPSIPTESALQGDLSGTVSVKQAYPRLTNPHSRKSMAKMLARLNQEYAMKFYSNQGEAGSPPVEYLNICTTREAMKDALVPVEDNTDIFEASIEPEEISNAVNLSPRSNLVESSTSSNSSVAESQSQFADDNITDLQQFEDRAPTKLTADTEFRDFRSRYQDYIQQGATTSPIVGVSVSRQSKRPTAIEEAPTVDDSVLNEENLASIDNGELEDSRDNENSSERSLAVDTRKKSKTKANKSNKNRDLKTSVEVETEPIDALTASKFVDGVPLDIVKRNLRGQRQTIQGRFYHRCRPIQKDFVRPTDSIDLIAPEKCYLPFHSADKPADRSNFDSGYGGILRSGLFDAQEPGGDKFLTDVSAEFLQIEKLNEPPQPSLSDIRKLSNKPLPRRKARTPNFMRYTGDLVSNSSTSSSKPKRNKQIKRDIVPEPNSAEFQRLFSGMVAQNYYTSLQRVQSEVSERRSQLRSQVERERSMMTDAQTQHRVLSHSSGSNFADNNRAKFRSRRTQSAKFFNKANDNSGQNNSHKLRAKSARYLRQVGPHIEIYEAYHPLPVGYTRLELNKAALTIQRFARGWLTRLFMNRLKEKAKTLGDGSWSAFVLSYKRHLITSMRWHGVEKPRIKCIPVEMFDYIDRRKRMENAFERRAYGNNMEIADLPQYFRDVNLFPTTTEINSGLAVLFRELHEPPRATLKKREVLQLTYYLYPPPGTGISVDRKSTWMFPIVDGEEGVKLFGTDAVEPTPLEPCIRLVSSSMKERKQRKTIEQT